MKNMGRDEALILCLSLGRVESDGRCHPSLVTGTMPLTAMAKLYSWLHPSHDSIDPTFPMFKRDRYYVDFSYFIFAATSFADRRQYQSRLSKEMAVSANWTVESFPLLMLPVESIVVSFLLLVNLLHFIRCSLQKMLDVDQCTGLKERFLDFVGWIYF